MRGYDALILIDISRQGGEPGTLYVMDAEPDDLEPIADGEMLSPHGMDPETVLRFVKAVGGWPGRVKIVACEPTAVEEMGLEMSSAVEDAVERAVELVNETVAELLTDAAYEDGRKRRRPRPLIAMHELSVSSRDRRHRVRHARGRTVSAVHLQVGAPAPGRPRVAALLLRDRQPRHGLRGRRARARADRRADALPRVRARMGPGARARRTKAIRPAMLPQFRCPRCEAAGAEVLAGDELLVDSIDVSEPPPALSAKMGSANGAGPHPSHHPS